jgi:II/X family phage/plasmid replication protein
VLVSGNPAKWFQGHNIFGSDDVRGLAVEMLHRICASVGVTPSPDDLAVWDCGAFRLSRADVTQSFILASLEQVMNALRSLDASANLRHRGRGVFNGEWLLFGKGSRRWSLTLYAKGLELKRNGLPSSLVESSLMAYAQRLLRVEVRLLSLQLVAEHLEYAAYWGDNTASELHSRLLAGLQIAEASMLDPATLEGLPPRLLGVYQLWRDGHDLRGMYPRRTFYRYRLELLTHGVDIAVKQERAAPDLSNVIPLRTVLHAYPATVPEWATGTHLYFEPRVKVAA